MREERRENCHSDGRRDGGHARRRRREEGDEGKLSLRGEKGCLTC